MKFFSLLAFAFFCLAHPAFGIDLVSTDADEVQADTNADNPSVSADGRYVVFDTDAALVPEDDNGDLDVYRKDRQTREIVLVSRNSDGDVGNGSSIYGHVSADGQRVVFLSSADNLVDGDMNGARDVFVRDIGEGQTSRMSVTSSGVEANGDSVLPPRISLDGTFIVFNSGATNLATTDANGKTDIFKRDVDDVSTLRLVSHTDSSPDTTANDRSDEFTISGDGKYVAFSSPATNLVSGDANGFRDIFRIDLGTGIIEIVSLDSAGNQTDGHSRTPSLSGNGNLVVFRTSASNMLPGDPGTFLFGEIFLRDIGGETNEFVVVDDSEFRSSSISGIGPAAISHDGSQVTFSSDADFLGGVTSVHGKSNVYRRDRTTGTTACLTLTPDNQGPDYGPSNPEISADGSTVVFSSNATNLISKDANGDLEDCFAAPGTDLTYVPPPVGLPDFSALRTALLKKLKKLKKKAKAAKKKGKKAKAKKFKKKAKKIAKQLRTL